MPEEATNTQKIQTLVAKIPSLSEAWSNAIEDQNDDTISEAWIATVEHFFPDTEDLNPESVLELLKSKELPCKNPSDFYHPINLIADILVSLTDDLCFGEMERLLEYCGLEPEGVVNTGSYYIDITKTLDGFSYELSEEDTEVESWLSSKRLSEADLVVICKDYEQEAIQSYASWTLAFSIEEKGNPENSIYSLFASDDEMFYYVEEQGQPDGKYQTSPKKAFYSSSLKINKSSLWEITEGQWGKDKILEYFEWQDLNIEWLASEDYTNAIELDPKDATNYTARGDAYNNLKKYPEAIADYTKAIELDPKYADNYYLRGNAYGDL